METILVDLGDKIPCLRHILHPEYAPYLTTMVTVLVGWVLVSWIFHVRIFKTRA